MATALASCIGVSTTNNPTPPAPGWIVYSSVETGVAITMPPDWRGFDLAKDSDAVLESLTREGTDPTQAKTALEELTRSGSRFVAIGAIPSGGAAFAYAVSSERPPEGRDAYVSGRPQTAGRTVVLSEHLRGNVGDVLHQRVRTAESNSVPSLQEQFFVERFDRLYVLFIQYQERAGPAFSGNMTLMGRAFTPIR
jgi:hypothetical protein